MRRALVLAIVIVVLVVVGLLFLAKPWSGGTGTVTRTASTYSKASWSWERLGRGVARILYGDQGVVYLTKDDLDYVLRGGVLKIPNPPDKRFGYCVVRYDQSTDSIVVACGPSYWDVSTVVLAVPVDQILFGTSNATRLPTLSGVLRCLDGEEITRGLWLRMRDFSASDPRIAPYIEWLRNALAPNPSRALNVSWYPGYRFWWFSDRYVWRAETPSNDSIVRLGLVKLPFGAGIVVTAYQVGSHVDIVVHGTIVNETEWRILLARIALFGGIGPDYLHSGYHYFDPVSDYMMFYVWRISNLTIDSGWALWRVQLSGHGSYLVVENRTLPIRYIYILLEMPVHKVATGWKLTPSLYWGYVEYVYWDIVGFPAFGLALHLAYPPNTSVAKLYEKVVPELTRRIVLLGVKHPGNILEAHYGTPFLIRTSHRGVCNEQSRSTALFASNALGALPAYIEVSYGKWGHAVSLLVYPSKLRYLTGVINLPTDVDGDGRNETGDIIVDTAELTYDYINTHIVVNAPAPGVVVEPPLRYVDPELATSDVWWDRRYVVALNYSYYYIGVIKALEELPRWLETPWYGLLPDEVKPSSVEHEAMSAFVELWRKYYKPFAPGVEPRKLFESLREMRRAGQLPTPVGYPVQPPSFWEKVLLAWLDYATGSWSYVPPGVALALNRTMSSIPVVFEGCTPSLREVLPDEVFEQRNVASSTPSNTTSNVGGSSSSSQQSQKHRRIEAVVVLDTVYSVVQDPVAGEVLVADRLRGTTVVGSTNITVIAVPVNYDWMGGRYEVVVYVNGSRAYGDWWGLQLPTTVAFERGGAKYVVRVEPPKPLVLDKVLNITVLEPMDSTTVLTKDGEVNVTIYEVNETIRLGNVTVLVVGDVGRLGVHLDIYIFGVPPTNYSATPVLVLPNGTAITMNATVEYIGHLHIQLCYDVPMDEEGKYMLLPQGTVLRIVIHPLNLAIEITLK